MCDVGVPPEGEEPIAQRALFDEEKDHQDKDHDGSQDRLQHGGEVAQERRALGLHRHGRRRGRRGRRVRLPRGGDVLDRVLEFPEHAPRARMPHLGHLLLEIGRVGWQLRGEGGELRLDGPPHDAEEARGQYHDQDGGQRAMQPPVPEGGHERGQQKGQEQREGHGDEHRFGPIQQGQGDAHPDQAMQKRWCGDFVRDHAVVPRARMALGGGGRLGCRTPDESKLHASPTTCAAGVACPPHETILERHFHRNAVESSMKALPSPASHGHTPPSYFRGTLLLDSGVLCSKHSPRSTTPF